MISWEEQQPRCIFMSIHTPTYTQGPTETSTKQHPLHCDYSYYSSSSCCRFRDTDFFLSAISVINYNICKYHSRYFIMLFFLFVCFFLNLAAKFKFNCELREKKSSPRQQTFVWVPQHIWSICVLIPWEIFIS